MSLLKKALLSWKSFSIQRAKLALLLKQKQDKLRAKLFTSWKRNFINYKKENLDVVMKLKGIRH